MDQEKQSSSKSMTNSFKIDAEFNIHKYNDISTVESLLNDKPISLLTGDYLSNNLTKFKVSQNNSKSNLSALVSSSNMGTHIEKLPKYMKTKSNPKFMVSHSVLNPISNYILSFCDFYNAGYPSAIKFSLLIAIGTSKGFLSLFDSSQKFLWHHKSDCGAVSAIDFNHNCSRLLVGYINGTIIMFDSSSTTCKLLQIMKDVHTPYTAVLHLKFTDLPNLAIINNSAGSVFELNFKKVFGLRSVESKRFFSGIPSKVYCIEPLTFNQLAFHPMSGNAIIAMATLSKIIIFALRPKTKLLLSNDITSSKPCLPLLSWQFIETRIKITSNSYHRIMNPVLIFIQADTLYFYVVNLDEENNLCCCNLQKISLPYMILACSWINHRTLLMMSSLEKVHLIDVQSRDEIEHFDLINISLVFTSSFYDNSNSQLLDKCCYSSVHSHNSQLILLAKNSVNIINVRSWAECLDSLTDKKHFIDALQLGVVFLEKKIKPIYDMRISHAPKQKIIEEKIINIVALYIDSMIEIHHPKSYKEGIPVVIDTCVHLKKTNILFSHLWDGIELFESSCNIFLEHLVNYLYNGQLNEVPTIIIQKLFTYLSLTNQLKKLEKCILNVKVEYLDIDQSYKLVQAHALHDGLISIWTRALQDYVAPLQELVPKITTTDGEYNDFTIELGNTILIYLSSCLLGIAYPNGGDIPKYLQDKVRSNIVQFLCSQHSIKAKDDEYIYPYLRILLKFNTMKFLKMLRISDHLLSNHQKQRIICILSALITNNKELTSNQLGNIYAFIVKWQKKGNNSIKLDKHVFETVIALLTSEQTTPLEEREEVFIKLIDLGEFDNNPNLFQIAEQAKFYDVCRKICYKREEYDKIFEYYILDKSKKHKIFQLIESKPEYFEQLTYDNVEVLLNIDALECGIIFGKFYQQYVCDISEQIKNNHQRYIFLKGVMPYVNSDIRLCTNYLELLCQFEPKAVMDFVERNNSSHLAKSIAATRITGLINVNHVMLDRLVYFEETFELLLIKLQNFIQQENVVEEYMEGLVSFSQKGSSILDLKSIWLSILQYLVSLQSHDNLKKVLYSNNFKLAPEMYPLLNSSTDTVNNLKNCLMGDLHNPSAAKMKGDKHCVVNPVICSLCKQKCINVPMIIFRCGHRFHSDCLGVQTTCTFCTSINNCM